MILQTCHNEQCSGLISLQLGLIDMGNSESQDAIVLQTCQKEQCSGLISLQLGLIDMGNSESQDP